MNAQKVSVPVKKSVPMFNKKNTTSRLFSRSPSREEGRGPWERGWTDARKFGKIEGENKREHTGKS